MAPANAQRPAELAGTVVDAVTRTPVQGAAVLLPETGATVLTDAAGRFVLRSEAPGALTVHVERLGYAPLRVRVALHRGETRHIDLVLQPLPVSLEAIDAEAPRANTSLSTRLDRAAIEASGAQTAADALRAVTGVIVQSTGPGSPQQVSIRGAAADAVLVLLDGLPLNDPVTGAADLSRVAASSIESIELIPGGQSARYGGRAAAGVILIETRRGAAADRGVRLGMGSLGGRELGAAWSGGARTLWSAGLGWRTQDGQFVFTLPPEAGGGRRERENADNEVISGHAALETGVLGGPLDLRAGHEYGDRGLPGRGYAPSRHARQTAGRTTASLRWQRTGADTRASTALGLSHLRLNHADAQPPFGFPYDDTTTATVAELQAEIEHRFGAATAGGGAVFRQHRLESTALAVTAPESFHEAGAFVHGTLPVRTGEGELQLTAQLRADRDATGDAFLSRSLTIGWSAGGLGLHVAHRTSFSPPTLSDRFFREGVGVEPNPLLGPERVPGEFEAGVRLRLDGRAGRASFRATAFTGDVRGMIVWVPDFRFVWSPVNTDAKRRGIETAAALESRDGRLRLTAGWAWVRATYDRTDRDDIQIAYRPAHSGNLDARARLGPWTFGGLLRYTGERTTAPTRVNTLPGFWTLDVAAAHTRRIGGWNATLDLRVERALDEKDTLIFGYPEPGRTLRLTLELRPGDAAPTLLAGTQ